MAALTDLFTWEYSPKQLWRLDNLSYHIQIKLELIYYYEEISESACPIQMSRHRSATFVDHSGNHAQLGLYDRIVELYVRSAIYRGNNEPLLAGNSIRMVAYNTRWLMCR